MKRTRLMLRCVLVMLTACGTADPSGLAPDVTPITQANRTTAAPSPIEAPSASAQAVTAVITAVPSPPPPSTTATPSATGTVLDQLPPGWQIVDWEDLMIPVPPDGVWETPALDREHINGAPVVASGTLTYPTSTAPVERPFGPSFTIVTFSGSLDEWLALERRNSAAGNPIQNNTVRDLAIADRPAKAYRHAVTGTGLSEDYALKLASDRLLLITTDDVENETYRRVIEGLVVESQEP